MERDPFLEPSQHISHITNEPIARLQLNPELLYKVYTPDQLALSLEIVMRHDPSLASPEGLSSILTNLTRELSENYGIECTGFYAAQTPQGGLEALTQEVLGSNLDGLESNSAVKPALDQLYTGLARYYSDKYRSGGYFWSDIRNDQFVYGHKPGESADKIYLVDLDPQFSYYNPDLGTDNVSGLADNADLFRSMGTLGQDLLGAIHEGGDYESARSAYALMEEAITEADRNRYDISLPPID